MAFTEKTYLLDTYRENNVHNRSLSLLFAVICIIDVFGVFPIITLPKTIINCGAYGLLAVTVICSAQIYTAILLGRSWILACKAEPSMIEKHRYPYSALVELTFGKKLSRCVIVLLNVTIFGGGIPNIVVAEEATVWRNNCPKSLVKCSSTNLFVLFGLKYSKTILASQNLNLFTIRLFGTNISYCWWILVVGTVLCPILWLGSPKDMKFVCSLSVVTVASVFLFVTTCLLEINITAASMRQVQAGTGSLSSNIWVNIAVAYGVLSFQFDIHPSLLAIQVDMKSRYKIDLAILYGFGGSLLMFLVTYMLAYSKLGVNINSSILESLPTSILLHLSALLVAFQLCLSSAISNSALYQHLEDHVGISKEFNFKRCLLRTSLTLVAVILAECVPQFDLVMSLIGGTLTGPLVFIFPPLIYVKLLMVDRKDNVIKLNIVQHPAIVTNEDDNFCKSILNKSTIMENGSYAMLEIIICFFVISMGVVGTFVTTYVNIVDSSMLSTFAKPCIYNISLIL